jgi:hypothetical protein
MGAHAAPKPAPQAAPRNLALVGVTQVGTRSQAWLMDTDSRTKETVSPGGMAFGFRVKSVGPEQVLLTRGGKEYALRLGERPIPTVAAVPVRTAAPTLSGTLVLPRVATLPEVFAQPVFVTPAPEVARDATATADSARARAAHVDPRLLPDVYPGYGALPGYGLVPGYGMVPGYGFDPLAASYPDAASALYGYPGYFGGVTPEEAYFYGMSPYPTASAWGSPYAGASPFTGNGLDLSAPRWTRQSGRRQNVDPFRGEISVNPQTQRRRARFSFPTQGQ